MKIISDPEWHPWWVGKKIMCSRCKRIVKLEEGDDKLPNWYNQSTDPEEVGWITISCERCGERSTMHRTKTK